MRGCLDNPQLKFRAVVPALGDFGGGSFAGNGVHDVHRAHYLDLFALLQDGTPSRLHPFLSAVATPKHCNASPRNAGGVEVKTFLSKRAALASGA